ncbi:MAG TPA: PIN domain-containing protein [Terracidiphilus sp.]|jgi:predicted nucleic acid-binding protein|nr:PIN domain-containing protein [Terracidiphilus sp.]
MNDRFFLDTNIFVYSFDRSASAKAKKAEQLIRKALTTKKGIVSYQVVQEFFNVALKRFSHPMHLADAEQYLTTVIRPLLGVHSSPALYGEALRMQSTRKLSWYDALIVSSAIQANCDVIYTEDLQNEQKFGTLQVKNPFI